MAIPASDNPFKKEKFSRTVLNIQAIAVRKNTISTLSSGPFNEPNSSFIEDSNSLVSDEVSKLTLKIILVKINQLQGSITALKGTPTLKTQINKHGEDMKGKFGRILGDFIVEDGYGGYKNGSLVTEIMIAEGHAVPYTGGSKEEIQEMHLKNRERLISEGIVTID